LNEHTRRSQASHLDVIEAHARFEGRQNNRKKLHEPVNRKVSHRYETQEPQPFPAYMRNRRTKLCELTHGRPTHAVGPGVWQVFDDVIEI
jgi:hypothetical protein